MPGTDNVVFRSKVLPPVVFKDENDFLWSGGKEPHAERRMQILKANPQIQTLFGHDPNTKYIVLSIVLLQLLCAWHLRSLDSIKSVTFWVLAYFIGGTVNHALLLAIHELSHNLAFKSTLANKLFSIFVCNSTLVVPVSVPFKPYHLTHHKYQGVDGMDTDLPTRLEGLLFTSLPGKIFFATFQIAFYAIRPIAIRAQDFTFYHALNIVYMLAIDVFLFYAFGPGAMLYLAFATVIAGSAIHPCAAHFFAEHYVFTGYSETYSYYGILNKLCFNVGYHNEHHDFPNIPGSRLPQLHAMASTFYKGLPHHNSWLRVTWAFISDPKVSVFNRVKRLEATQLAGAM